MSDDLEPYENTLSVEELRRELRRAWDVHYGFMKAIRDAVDMPDPFILKEISYAARHPQDWETGNKIQRELGFERVPPVSECESGAGLWVRIRRGLVG